MDEDHFVLDIQLRLEPLVDRKFVLPQPTASHRLLVPLDKAVSRAEFDDVVKYLVSSLGLTVKVDG